MLETAAGIAATAPIASRLTKLALRDGGPPDFESALQWEALAQPVTLATADLQEGIRAAREKRAAGVHAAADGPATPHGGTEKGPRPHRCVACLPLASAAPTGRGPHLRPTLGARSRAGQRVPSSAPVDNLWTAVWTVPADPVDTACGSAGAALWRTRPGRRAARALTSEDGSPPGVDGKISGG